MRGECGQRIRNTGVQEGSIFREETEGGCAELQRDLGHHVVKHIVTEALECDK